MIASLLWLPGVVYTMVLPKLTITLPNADGLTFEEECHIDYRAYHGVRLLEIRRLDFPSLSPLGKDIVLLGCEKGVPEFSLKLDPENIFDTDIIFNNNTHETDIIRLSRRHVYAQYRNQKLRYIPDTVVGGVYLTSEPKVPNQLTTTDDPQSMPVWHPLSPLIGDSWTRTYQHYGFNGNMVEISLIMSLLRSPDVLDDTYPKNDDWTQNVPVYVNGIPNDDEEDSDDDICY